MSYYSVNGVRYSTNRAKRSLLYDFLTQNHIENRWPKLDPKPENEAKLAILGGPNPNFLLAKLRKAPNQRFNMRIAVVY